MLSGTAKISTKVFVLPDVDEAFQTYLQFLYPAKGSLAEAFTRACGLMRARLMAEEDFNTFDTVHYEVEKLLHLLASLETKRDTNQWQDSLPQLSNNPPIRSSKYRPSRAGR